MSQATRSEANEDSESDSTTSSSRFSSSGGGGGGGCCTESSSSSKTQATTTSDASAPTRSTSSSDRITNGNGHELQQQQQQQPGPSSAATSVRPTVSTTRVTNETEERNNHNNKSDEVIQRSQQETGQKCDTTTTTAASRMRHATGPSVGRSGPGRPSSTLGIFQDKNHVTTSATSSHLHPASISADRPTTTSFSDIRQASLTGSPRVSPVAISSLNISSPLDRLSECDAITRRLLSSPIRTVNLSEKPTRRSQANCELDKSRRASLGTKSITEQVSLFAANQFNSLELSYAKSLEDSLRRDQRHRDDAQSLSGGGGGGGGGSKQQHLQPKQQQQLTVRSLSVCQEETLKPRGRNYNNNSSSPSNHRRHPHHHSSHLNRAVSLACESSSDSTATTTTTRSERSLTIIPLFGCDIKALEQYMRSGLILPPPIDSAINHILTHGIDAIGIFRKSGVKSRILTLKQRIENNQDARVDEINVENEFSIYDIADLVKMWFRELKPAPIMTRDLIRRITIFLQAHREDGQDVQGEDGAKEEHRNSSQISRVDTSDESTFMQRADARSVTEMSGGRLMMRQISSLISPAHKVLISRAMSFFAAISSKSETNQMTSQNLAICLTPSLCATETDQVSILLAQRALKYCIDNYVLWQEDPNCS